MSKFVVFLVIEFNFFNLSEMLRIGRKTLRELRNKNVNRLAAVSEIIGFSYYKNGFGSIDIDMF